ncbi:hypothetical protein [Roseicella frigidaeris]|nr:hypothetical protein [Roseicella frigidaeris]
MDGIARKTDPALWDRVASGITTRDEGGRPGERSARKARRVAQDRR